jgi:hypothetical protein
MITQEVKIDPAVFKQLEQIPERLTKEFARPIMTALAKPIVVAAGQLAESGKEEDYARQGKNKTRRFDPAWAREHKSKEHMGFKILYQGRNGPFVLVGPKWRAGGKLNFNNSPKGRRVWYWGKDMGKVRPGNSPSFIEKAKVAGLAQGVSDFTQQVDRAMTKLAAVMVKGLS